MGTHRALASQLSVTDLAGMSGHLLKGTLCIGIAHLTLFRDKGKLSAEAWPKPCLWRDDQGRLLLEQAMLLHA